MKTKISSGADNNPWLNFSKNLKRYKSPSLKKSLWQIANTFIPYVGAWVLIVYSLNISLWLTAPLIILAGGLLVRLFIIFHDCGHGSYFKSDKANKYIGMFFGILALTPYHKWHYQHLQHHATVGNLDKRGVGDVWTMTKKEYENADKRLRFKYRMYRNPFIMFGIGPLFMFLGSNRFTQKWMTKKQKQNVWFTNFAVLLMTVGMGLAIGFVNYIVIQLLIMQVAGMAGFWLFYLQHQYDDVVWYKGQDWKFQTVALEGSSYLKFPKILHWFSGNIGYHHIHHLNATIPNYNLPMCFRENDVLKQIKPVTFWESVKTLRLRLWDEQQQKLVPFKG